MKSLATLLNLYTTLSQNISASNQSLGLQILGDKQRYLLQKYFDNERTYQTTTVGGGSLTTTASLSLGATSATLTAAWTYPTVYQQTSFSNSNARSVLYTNGSTAISWVGGLTSSATTTLTTAGVQDYAIPATISKITSDFIQVGQLRFVPVPIQTRVDWDRINFLPYASDIVNYAYIYQGNLKFWPIPSTTGNIIQFNYKARVPDFTTTFLFSSAAGAAYSAGATVYDYGAGTITPPAVGATAVTGSSTSWNTTGKFPLNVDVTWLNLYLQVAQPNGDGLWYPIYMFNSDTSLTLATPMQNQLNTAGGATYSIGQMPVLSEDFHDMPVDGALMRYFSTFVKNGEAYKEHEENYNRSLALLEEYAGTKQVNVDLESEPVLTNPNNYPYAQP